MSKRLEMLAAGAGLLVLSMGPALADGTCACRLPLSGSPIVGTVVAASGAVFLSQPTGMQPALVGSPLRAGSRMMTGPKASASVRIGSNCTLSLSGGANLRIQPEGRNLCVRRIEQADMTGSSQGGNPSTYGYPAAGLPGAAGLSTALPATIPSVILDATIASGVVLDATEPPVSR